MGCGLLGISNAAGCTEAAAECAAVMGAGVEDWCLDYLDCHGVPCDPSPWTASECTSSCKGSLRRRLISIDECGSAQNETCDFACNLNSCGYLKTTTYWKNDV